MFLLGDFRKKVDKNVKGARYVSAFRKALEQQKTEKDKQDAIRDQYDKVIVDRFFPVEHTDTGLTKRMLGLNPANPDEVPPEQGQVGVSRIDRIDPMDNAASGMEKYQPCRSSVFPPAQFHGLDDTDPQWQREPSSHLALDFAYGYQGSSCWDQDLFGIGPGLNNLNFVYYFDPSKNVMRASSEIVYHTAAACVVNALDTNMQRFFYHSDDVTAMALLVRRHQGPDGMWVETNKPLGSKEKSDWTKWFAYSKGIHTPDRTWSPTHRTLPVSTEEWPCLKDGAEYDWRTWDLPNRCIVASGQKGRNPTIYVWRIVCPRGEHVLTNQLLAKMNIGAKRREVAALSFNSQGTLLVTLCQDFEQHIQVYDWRVGTMIREGPGGAKIECLMFNPFSASAFASCGEKHLKFWELGDADLEMAAGLFGDLGEAINIYSITFHPRGLTISGTISGDIYVWSNGTVTAKIAGAHKGKVLGLLYVPDVALFSSGEGGEIKMWDPNLSDTKRPLGIVDLRSLCGRKGDFQLLQKLCGRSLDWSTDETMLECLCDDNPVLDLPAQNVCGAPATHLSFRDLGVRRETGGVLLIGTTCNSILALGIRRVEDGSWAKDGLSGATPLNGDSKNSKEDSLERQDFWAKVEQYKGKNGAKAGHLPVAVYKYQTNNPSAPGYRGPNQMGCPWKLACCGKKILVNGHFGEARCVVPMPNERIFVSGSQDRTVRLWDINDQTMIDCFESPYPISCAKWWSKHTADGTVGEEEVVKGKSNPVLTVGHSNGSFSIWRFEVAANEAAAQDDAGDKNPFYDPEDAFGECTLCCVNPLPRRSPGAGICSLNYSDDGKYLGVGTGDNCVDIYRHNLVLLEYKPFGDVAREQARQKTLGLSDAEIARQDCFPYKRIGCMNDHSANVLGIDFATDGTVFRSVSASNELLFGSLPSGKFNTATQECSQKKYGTHTCKFGWTVKSIWAKGSTADDINSIDVSKNKVPPWAPCFGGTHPAPYPLPFNFTPNGSVDPVDKHRVKNFPGEGSPTTWGHQVCVTAQDDGKVKLFRWPAFGFKQHFRSYIGHGSQCTDVRFTHDDDYILSAGGADMSIFQWRHVIPNKIYVQNLPDATGPDGKYKIGYWDLYRLLEDFFSKMLKADTEHVRSARLENAEVKKAVDKAKSEGMSAEVEPLLKYRVAKVVVPHIHRSCRLIPDLYLYVPTLAHARTHAPRMHANTHTHTHTHTSRLWRRAWTRAKKGGRRPTEESSASRSSAAARPIRQSSTRVRLSARRSLGAGQPLSSQRLKKPATSWTSTAAAPSLPYTTTRSGRLAACPCGPCTA